MDPYIVLGAVLLLIYGVECSPSVRTVFYLHTTPRTWNEAKLICEAETAEMFRVDDSETIQKLLYVDGTTDWNGNFTQLLSQEQVWLALYETQDPANPYLYHGCIRPDSFNWGSAQPQDPPEQELCVAMDSNYDWSTHQCNESFHFICQRPDGECWFDPKEDTLGVAQSFPVDDTVVADEAACATLCRNGWINNTECWGFSYRKSDKMCRTHFHNETTIFILNTPGSVIADADWTFFTKICLGGLVRTVDVNYVDTTTEPHVLNCTDLVVPESDWDESVCYCECGNPPAIWEPTISSLSLQEKIQQIVEELSIDTKNTSAAQRKLISVMDIRPSAQSIGYIGIVFLSVVFGSIIILDMNVLLSHTNKLIKSIKDPDSSTA